MSSFHFNIHSKKGYQEQWHDYLQQKSYHSGTEKAINQFRAEYNENAQMQIDAIEEQGNMMKIATQQQTYEIVGSIGKMSFEITEAINDFADKLDWRMSELIDQQKIGNILKYNIAQLLRIPEFQKERQYYVEQGIKHYKNAIIDPDIIEHALDNLLLAEKLEKTDYFVLHRIGLIYLYQPKFVDLEKAKRYLTLAAKFASVETNPDASHIANILSADLTKPYSSENINLNSVKQITAESFYQAAITCYALGEYNEAYELALNAYKHSPSLIDSKFVAAKCLSIMSKIEQATILLGEVISVNRLYAPRIVLDLDFNNQKEVIDLLLDLKNKKNSELKTKINTLKDKYLKIEIFTDKDFESIEEYLISNSYLDACSGLDELEYFNKKLEAIIVADNVYKKLVKKNNALDLLIEEINKTISSNYHSSQRGELHDSISTYREKFRQFSILIKERYDKKLELIEERTNGIQNELNELILKIKKNLEYKISSVENKIKKNDAGIDRSLHRTDEAATEVSNNSWSSPITTILFIIIQLYFIPAFIVSFIVIQDTFTVVCSWIPVVNLMVVIYGISHIPEFARCFWISFAILLTILVILYFSKKKSVSKAYMSENSSLISYNNENTSLKSYLQDLNKNLNDFKKNSF